MNDLTPLLRGSVAIAALPKLIAACEKLYGHANKNFMELSDIAAKNRAAGTYSSAQDSANDLAVMLLEAELALAPAIAAVEVPRIQLVQR